MAKRNKKKAFVDAMKDIMVPLILGSTVKGDERIESAKIIWEDAGWSVPRISEDGEHVPPNPNGELVVEVTVQEKLATKRGSPWRFVQEICCIFDTIDWQRSNPYSVQEIRHSFGVEAARDCILQRLNLTSEATGTAVKRAHMKLLADLMVYSGDVIGISSFGYRDLLRSFKTSAPFTAGAFRAPVKTFMEAGEKADEEPITGVLASSMFGKRVPVGTGADFILHLKPTVNADPTKFPEPSKVPMDILDSLKELNSKIPVEIPDTPPPLEEFHMGTTTGDGDMDVNETEKWGDEPVPSTNNDWGAADAGGSWGANPSAADAGRSWSANSPPLENAEASGWESNNPSEEVDVGSWVAKLPSPNGRSASPRADGWGEEVPAAPSANGCDDARESVWNASPPCAEEATGRGAPPPRRNPGNGGPPVLSWGAPPPPRSPGNGGPPVPSWGAPPPLRNPRNGAPPVPSWGAPPPPKVDGSVMQDNATTPGWDLDQGQDDTEDPWAPRGSRESRKTSSSSRREEPREFKPTGANNIPLGKVRQFGTRVVEGPSNENAPVVKLEALGRTPESPRGGDQEAENLPTNNNIGEVKETDSNWTPVQDSGSEARWGNMEDDQGLKTSPSGWSPPRPGNIGVQHSCRGADHQGQSMGVRHGRSVEGRIDFSSGVLTPSREPPRRMDSRIDSTDWKEVINLVRAVKSILMNSVPEEKLSEESQNLLMTQVLPHHPSYTTKVGCGLDFLKVGNYKGTTKCFFLVRTDGTQEDFSYHKCLLTMAKKKDPPVDDLYNSAFMNYNFRASSDIGRIQSPVASQSPITASMVTQSQGNADQV